MKEISTDFKSWKDRIGFEENKYDLINIKLVETNKNQPRKEFNEETLLELSKSIEDVGIIQPILVKKDDNKYIIIAGERRYRAALIAGLKEIPVIITDLDKFNLEAISIIENIQREDLTPYDEAVAYKNLMNNYNLTQKEIGEKLSKSRSYIANTVRLLNLDSESLDYLKEGKITSTQARTLLSIDRIDERHKAIQKFLDKESSVNDIEKKYSKNKKKDDIFITEIEEKLSVKFESPVRLKKSGETWKLTFILTKDQLNSLLMENL